MNDAVTAAAPDIVDDAAGYFDRLFATSDDPWAFKQRWYEARKRALTLAALPHPRYANAYEPGCANAELSAALAPRCDRLLISDIAPAAVELARRRVAALPQVEVRRAVLPHEWPANERFDLIVISELAYYLDDAGLDSLATQARDALRADGVIVACHWRPRIDGCRLDGDAVHARFAAVFEPTLTRLSSLRETDFRLDVWSADARSPAEREGLR